VIWNCLIVCTPIRLARPITHDSWFLCYGLRNMDTTPDRGGVPLSAEVLLSRGPSPVASRAASRQFCEPSPTPPIVPVQPRSVVGTLVPAPAGPGQPPSVVRIPVAHAPLVPSSRRQLCESPASAVCPSSRASSASRANPSSTASLLPGVHHSNAIASRPAAKAWSAGILPPRSCVTPHWHTALAKALRAWAQPPQ